MALGQFLRAHGSRVLFLLAVLSLVAAGVCGQLAGSVNGIKKYLPEVFPEATEFSLLDDESSSDGFIYVASDGNGHQLGYVTATEGQGYGGPMTVMMAWSPEGTVLNLVVTDHHEDMPWLDKLYEQEFFDQYIGRQYSMPLLLDEDIDAVSGSTVSCVGVAMGVQFGRHLVSGQLGDPCPAPEEPISFGTAEILLLVGLGTVVGFRMVPSLRKWHWRRYFTLLFGFIVLGVWLAIPLSLTNFATWLLGYGPHLETNVIMYILVFGVVGLAVLLGRNFYCFWLCPFAAVMEGLHLVSGGSLQPTVKWRRRLRNTRYFLLWMALFLVLLLGNPTVSVFEPWNTLFSFKGTADQWLLVVVTLGVAMFIYDFWCHYLCPVGATMDIILKVRREVSLLWARIKPRPTRTA